MCARLLERSFTTFSDRETMQQLLDYRAECTIHPRASAIFGLHRVDEAFHYYMAVPDRKVLIDVKNCDRLTLCDKFQ